MGSQKFIKKLRYMLRYLPDEPYIQLNYFLRFHRRANLDNPVTFNEKLNWMKLHDHNPLYTKMVDKYEMKNYVSDIIGGGYTIPTLGLWEDAEEINFDVLPSQFVLKCTHDSEGVIIVKDKSKLDFDETRRKLKKLLNQNFYYIGREWPYKEVKPRIIAEQYMEDKRFHELRDYKFFCFNGEPKVMFIASGREANSMTCDFYDMEFNHLDITRKYPHVDRPQKKPDTFMKMIELSKKLSQGFPHIRVDLYEVEGKIYVGEFTFYTSSGFVPFKPSKWDRIMGEWIDLPSPIL